MGKNLLSSIDRNLMFIHCGKVFIFSLGEQEFYKKHSLTTPERCKKCSILGKRRKIMFKENIVIIGRKNFKGVDRMIDVYIKMPSGEEEYLFSKKYSNNSYNLCKGGIRINALIATKSRDFGVMRMVGHVKRMVPYIKEEFQVA